MRLNINRRRVADRDIFDFLAGRSDERLLVRIERWRALSAANEEMFRKYRDIYLALCPMARIAPGEAEKIWREFRTRLDGPGHARPVGRRSMRRRLSRTLWPVAAACTGFAVGVLPVLNRIQVESAEEPERADAGEIVFSVPFGSRAVTTLVDGTVIHVNAGSTLRYPALWEAGRREVRLEGEAYFIVSSDPSRPFIVSAGDASVTATGTAFNVTAYPSDGRFCATLVDGAVRFEDGRGNGFDMRPNQTVISFRGEEAAESAERAVSRYTRTNCGGKVFRSVNEPVLILESASAPPIVSWKEALWTLDCEPLGELFPRMGRRYNVVFDHSPEVGGILFSGTFENETIDEIMRIIYRATPIRYNIDRGRITVSLDTSRLDGFEHVLNR